jgi:GntR family transcriptional regulator/MocR family aminotransferase
MSILIKIDTKSTTPIFRQIIDRIIKLIESKAIKPDMRLPSTRIMADKLSVNRSTVYNAYQELWALGYLESRPGAYTTVRKRINIVTRKPKARNGIIKWAERINSGSEKILAAYLKDEVLLKKATGSGVINFIPLSPDSRLLPLDTFRKCMNDVLVRQGAELLQYGSPLGYQPLRDYIAERMRAHSVSISSDEIMITTGAQNAVELLLKMLTVPGAGVAVEAPTYSRVIDILQLSNLKIIEVPMKSDGMDLDALNGILDQQSPAIIYTMPNFHNPTGITTPQDHREKLLRICERSRIPLIEDGFEEELKYFGRAVLPIKSMDHGGVVIYIGTFSKILFPGLRIGWIAADKKLISSLVPIQRASIISGNLLDQAAVYRFCRMGHYDLHLKRMHQAYRNRMQKAMSAMQTYLNHEQVDWTQPAGGYTIWLMLKDLNKHENRVVEKLIEHGVAVLPGSTHFHGTPGGLFFRISIAHLDEQAIEEGIKRLAAGLAELYSRQS